jgi:hypothetical protein
MNRGPAGAGEVTGLTRHGDRPDAALEPDLAGLDIADLEVVLDPVPVSDLVGVDVRCAVGGVVQQHAEPVGGG